MRIQRILLFVALLGSCVPASEPLPPAGAGGLQTDPSPAARGEPFISRDGWRVTIDKLIVRAGPQVASKVPDRFGYRGYSMWEPAIFNAKERLQLYTPEIPPGPATVSVTYDQYSIYIGPGFTPYDDHAEVTGAVLAVDAARFQQVADQGFEADAYGAGYVTGHGPSIVIELRASKDGSREATLKAAVSNTYSSMGFNDDDDGSSSNKKGASSEEGIPIEIRANALTLARLEIAPEKVFTTPGRDGIDVGRLIRADPNKDGEVTGAELATIEVDNKELGSYPLSRNSTLLDLLADKLKKHLLTPRAL